MNGFLTADSLKDFATLMGVVVILVQFFKGALDSLFSRVLKTGIQTKYVTYLFSLALVLMKANLDGGITLEALPILLINAVVLALAAMKGFEEFVEAGRPANPFDSHR